MIFILTGLSFVLFWVEIFLKHVVGIGTSGGARTYSKLVLFKIRAWKRRVCKVTTLAVGIPSHVKESVVLVTFGCP